MKKLIIIILLVLGFTAFIGCENVESTTSTTTTITTTETSSETTTTTLHPDSLAANIPSECAGIEIISGWVPVWCEEFNYTGSVDNTKWNYVVGGGGFGNNELQYYTNRQENAYVDGEKLIITALKESYNGSNYTSSKIWTNGLHNFKYGKFEVRAKVPSDEGTWPAFWMMPKLSVYGGWPNSGEIDILEHVGNNLDTVLGTIHTEKYNHILGTQIGFSKYVNGLSEDFHTYSVTWSEYSMSWYIDSIKYGSTIFDAEANAWNEPNAAWPFDQEFYLILNFAMGGGLGGQIDPNFISDTYEIDYVRVYQRDYVTLDNERPTNVMGIKALNVTSNSASIVWDRSRDTNNYTGYGQVREYIVYLNDSFERLVSLNTVRLTDLQPGTSYKVQIQSVDYAGNVSDMTDFTFSTNQ